MDVGGLHVGELDARLVGRGRIGADLDAPNDRPSHVYRLVIDGEHLAFEPLPDLEESSEIARIPPRLRSERFRWLWNSARPAGRQRMLAATRGYRRRSAVLMTDTSAQGTAGLGRRNKPRLSRLCALS